MSRPIVTSIVWIAILGLALAVLAPGLGGGFFFDDGPNIVDNPAVQIKTFDLDSLAASLQGLQAGPLGRPVSVISFALTHIYFGLDPFAYKATNLAIHLLNGLLVGWLTALLLRVLRVPLSPPALKWLPIWVSALWLVHPIHHVAIMMAVQRMTLLSATFTLLALVAHLKAMRDPATGAAKWLWFMLAWLVFWPLAFLSKETGLLFPLYLLAVVLFLPPTTTTRNRILSAAVASVALVLVGMGMFWHLGLAWLDAAYAMRPFTLTERLLTEARVVWFYLRQILLPSYQTYSLYLDWIPISTGLFKPVTTPLAIAGWGIAIGLVVLLRRRAPLVSFGLLWFLLGHSLESSILPLEIAHEHRNYLPAIGLLLAAGYIGVALMSRVRLDHPKVTIPAVALVPILLMALFSWLRADQMSSPLPGLQIEATRHPQSARANHTAALALMAAGYGDVGDPIGAQQVRYHFEQAERADPTFKLGYLGLLIWACASGRPIEPQWIDAFAQRLQQTPFQHGQVALPAYLLRSLISMPGCLPREQALRLFEAGAANARIGGALRVSFLEAASDYELIVARDVNSARSYLESAFRASGGDLRLMQKLQSYTMRN